MQALRQVALERNLPPEMVLRDLEAALSAAFRKESSLAPYHDLKVKVHPLNGEIHVLVSKLVVEKVTDPIREISLEEARRLNPEVKEGEFVEVELAREASRIAVQIAKQTLVQRLRKTEEITVFEEFQKYEGGIVSGTIQKKERGQVWVDLEQATALLPEEEQIPGERYQLGQRLRFYVLKVRPSANKGFQILLSRAHKNFLLRLLELEVPEVYQGKVEIKAVAREAGSRSKVAVAAKEKGIDPVGACIGPRGIRIMNITRELNGEKVDLILWDEDQAKFIANALSPAQVSEVKLIPEEKRAVVIIPDKQFSLAIGKDGQNARLAAKLTGWRIDIKPLSLFEKEQAQAELAEAKLEPVRSIPEVEVKKEQAQAELAEAKLEPVRSIPEVEVKKEQAQAELAEAKLEPVRSIPEVEVKKEPVKPLPERKEKLKTIEELLASIQAMTQKKLEPKFIEEPLPVQKEKKKVKKGLKPKRLIDEEEEDYY